MWLTPGRVSGHKNSALYSSSTLLKKECYEEEVQPYRKTDYKPLIYIYISCPIPYHMFRYCVYMSSIHFPIHSRKRSAYALVYNFIYSLYIKTINVITFVFNSFNLHSDNDYWICDTDILFPMFTWTHALACVSFQNGRRIYHPVRRHVHSSIGIYIYIIGLWSVFRGGWTSSS